EHPEQRGFSAAVASDQADLLPRVELQVGAVEEGVVAEGETGGSEGEERHGEDAGHMTRKSGGRAMIASRAGIGRLLPRPWKRVTGNDQGTSEQGRLHKLDQSFPGAAKEERMRKQRKEQR